MVIDPPHLLKSLRNDFLTKDVIWGHKTASWQDIKHVYDIDKKLGSTRVLSTLTEYHMEPQKIRKNNVSVAAQVLSARTAAILKYTHAICKRSKLFLIIILINQCKIIKNKHKKKLITYKLKH